MSNITIVIVFPILGPIPFEQPFSTWFENIKSDILAIVDMPEFFSMELDNKSIQIEELIDSGTWPLTFRRLLKRFDFRYPSVFRFTLTYNYNVEPDGSPMAVSNIGLIPISVDIVIRSFARAISDVAFLCGVAKPGCLQTMDGEIYLNNELFDSYRSFVDDFSLSVGIALKQDWPPIYELALIDVLRWAKKIPGFDEGVTKDSLGRALGAVSYLIKPSTSSEQSMDIIWALLGLEALYGSGTADLSRQLREKTEVYLGKRKQFKKQFGQSYDIRSRLIHGDKDFAFAHDNDSIR